MIEFLGRFDVVRERFSLNFEKKFWVHYTLYACFKGNWLYKLKVSLLSRELDYSYLNVIMILWFSVDLILWLNFLLIFLDFRQNSNNVEQNKLTKY